MTTRLRNLDPNFIQEISLDVLSPEKEPGKALELLKKLLGNKDERVDNQPAATTAICELLEYLPLGIELVGGYLVRDLELSLDTMLRRLQERKLTEAALQDRETINSKQLGIKAAFALTWDELDPVAQKLGRFLSLFAPQLIFWDLVIWVATRNQNIEQTETETTGEEGSENAALLGWGADELNTAKKQLYERNLLQQVEDSQGFYQIHALVRWFLQAQLANAGEMQSVLETTFANAMITLAQKIPQSPTSEQIKIFSVFVPHLEDLGNRLIAEINQADKEQIISPASVPNEQVIGIFVGVGRFYEGQGLYQLAEPWGEQCVTVCQALFAGDYPDVATSLNNLAALYCSQGRYSEAEPLLVEALAMCEQVLGVNHPNTVTCRENLTILQRQLSPVAMWKHRFGQFLQFLLIIIILPFYLLWLLVKKIIRNL